MNFKRFLLICCILMTLLLVSTVSAADNNTSDLEISDDGSLNQLSSEAESFDDLAFKINNTDKVLVLDKNYTYSGNTNDGILINKSITIDGKGYTLNGDKQSRIFNIKADNVTLMNINFINGKALGLYDEYDGIGGGAIYWDGANGKLINCTFTNNVANGLLYDKYAQVEEVYDLDTGIGYTIDWPSMRPFGASTDRGGAIVWRGSNAYISKCVFSKNSVDYPNPGGAIFMTSENALVESSSFTRNSAYNGEAIYYYGKKLFINNSYINESSAYGRDYAGVAGVNFTIINAKLSLDTLISQSFSDLEREINNAQGTLILNKNYTQTADSSVSITKSITIDGQGHTIDAKNSSAIFFINADNVVLKNINFINAKSTHVGGAIAWIGDNAQIINCNFVNCTSHTAGGSVALKGNNAKIINSSFINSYVIEGTWGLFDILNNFNPNLIYITVMASIGGAVYIDGSNALFNNTTFKNNSVFTYNVEETPFNDGIVYLIGDNPVVDNCRFDNNIFKYNLYYELILKSNNATVSNSIFTNESRIYCNSFVKYINNTPDNLFKYDLRVSNFTSTYKSGDKLLVSLYHDYDMVSGVNVSVKVYNASELIGTYNCLSGDYLDVDLDIGNYTAVFTVEGISEVNSTLTIGKINTKISVLPVTTVYQEDNYLIATLTDSNNNPLVNASISVNLNGVKTYVTDLTGQIKVPTKDLTPKTYTATLSFAGDDKYINSQSSANVVINKVTPKLTAAKKAFKLKTKSKKYEVTLKDNSKAINKAKITLKVNGKTYKATTNSKGKATFKITKLNKKGTFKAVITYAGNTFYNKVTKSVQLNVKK